MTSSASPTCKNCGAPDAGDLVICRFCKQAVSTAALESAIPCPNQSCRALCRWGKQKCPQCQSWLVVSCVFCGSLSPHNLSNCLQCREAFAGAPQRKAQMEQHRLHQQNMQQMHVVGNLASGLLGGMAGVAIMSSDWGSGSSDSDFTGGSGIDDDASFDWGGGDGGDFGGGDDY